MPPSVTAMLFEELCRPMSAGIGQTWPTSNLDLRNGESILWVLQLGFAAGACRQASGIPELNPWLAPTAGLTFQVGGPTSEAATGFVQRCNVAARISSEPLRANLALMCLR